MSTLGRRKAHTKAGRQEEQYGSRNQRYCSEYKGDVCGDAMT